MSQRYNLDLKAALDALLLEVPGIKPGQMMGHPGYFIGGKMFACLVETGFIVKLPGPTRQALLAQENTSLFAPGGSPMRQWVQINLDDGADYARYTGYLQEAIEYVLEKA